MPQKLTAGIRLDDLILAAEQWLRDLQARDASAVQRLKDAYPGAADPPTLEDVQTALALQYEYPSWLALILALDELHAAARPDHTEAEYEQLARDFVAAYEGDATALARLNQHDERQFTWEDHRSEIWGRIYAFRQRSSRVPKNYVELDEARIVIAQNAGYGSWPALLSALSPGGPAPVAAVELDTRESRIGPRRRLNRSEWDDLISHARALRITSLDARGLMSDSVLERVSRLEHVTSLTLGGSRELSDDGLAHLARMPQLRHLELSEYPGGKLTDRGLAVLRHLPELRSFHMTWQAGITDAGTSNLRFCHHLEQVNLMGSPTGDGTIEALQGKPALRHFSTGRLVTDAGLAFLQGFPGLKQWNGMVPGPGSPDPLAGGARLLIDGPFTDQGLATLAGLDGLAEIDLFWHVSELTPAGFAHLRALPNLASLGCDGELSGNEAMHHLGSLPNLRKLRAQESVATDEGFEALARSTSLEFFWGRVCPNFGNRGFLAFSRMPALRGLGIGCANVDDDALAALPDFPALHELTPVGVQDPGFRHIGRCRKLDRLTCMYCRDTTDLATEQIVNLPLKYYYAGLTKITDLSLQVLGRMPTLEQVDLYECNGVTDAGLPYLAALPRLRRVGLDSLPGVTLDGTKVFPAGVQVHYTT